VGGESGRVGGERGRWEMRVEGGKISVKGVKMRVVGGR
jgi:hypothetical protein